MTSQQHADILLAEYWERGRTMTYDNWKATNLDDALIAAAEEAVTELELCYGALHQALETKCALVKALQQIKHGLENLEETPGRRDLRWMSRSTKHDMWRVARDALAAVGAKP